ncbi:hypothetical protein D0Z08_05225 [Nocardioides immobilis]|uniref:Single-stranded DNA-binding protein n=1 Tax=Nocardioides immobilis TaxID=2049295 RepID=A0A417Y6U3_9ACTN|nr:hypothetical protein D0Z08_05225 [Nocardioides immobilis]
MSSTVTFAGNLAEDPELLYTHDQEPFVSCRVLVNRRIQNEAGEWVNDLPDGSRRTVPRRAVIKQSAWRMAPPSYRPTSRSVRFYAGHQRGQGSKTTLCSTKAAVGRLTSADARRWHVGCFAGGSLRPPRLREASSGPLNGPDPSGQGR